MPEISRLSVNSDWIDLGFMERERTPQQAMKLGIQMHVAGLSLSLAWRLYPRPTRSPPAHSLRTGT